MTLLFVGRAPECRTAPARRQGGGSPSWKPAADGRQAARGIAIDLLGTQVPLGSCVEIELVAEVA